MRRRTPAGALLLLPLVLLAGAATASGASSTRGAVTPTLLPTQVTTMLGHRFTVQARINNESAVGPALAHLNVVSLDQQAYVDPEDWSPERTRQIPALAAGVGTTLSWEIQAVNAGRFAVYYVVIPLDAQPPGSMSYFVSTPTDLTVTARRTLDPGGALAVAVAVPVLVGVVALVARRRNRDPR